MSQFVCDYHGVHEIPEIKNSTFRNPEPWLIESIAGPQSESGIRVTPGKILSHAPIWQGVNIISGDCGMLPKMLKKRLKDGGSEDNTTHNAFRLVAQRANPLMLSLTFCGRRRQMLTKTCCVKEFLRKESILLEIL